MKTIFAVTLLLFRLVGISQTIIPPDTLSAGYRMTTNLIFPYPVEKADIGSGDLIAKKAGAKSNILFLKAGRKNFAPTNLSVYTSDGSFYSFIVKYSAAPDTLNIRFAKRPHPEFLLSDAINDARLDSDALLIARQAAFLHQHIRAQQIRARLQGIYIKDHLLWFRMEISNYAETGFDPESIRFSIRGKRLSRRTAVQEDEKSAVWQTALRSIAGQSTDTVLYAFPAFTIPRQKRLIIQITEQNEGRTPLLPVSARTILRARKAAF